MSDLDGNTEDKFTHFGAIMTVALILTRGSCHNLNRSLLFMGDAVA